MTKSEKSEINSDNYQYVAWGSNDVCQIKSDKDKGIVFLPEKLPFKCKIKQIACGFNTTAIICEDGVVWTCGNNTYGQCGYEEHIGSYSCGFKKVNTKNFNGKTPIKISFGARALYVLLEDGNLLSCGRNYYGQLGYKENYNNNISYNCILKPVNRKYLGNKKIIKFFAGGEHLAVITEDSKLYTCGRNLRGQLGTDELLGNEKCGVYKLKPDNDEKFKDEKIVEVSCGLSFTVIILSNNKCLTCGNNTNGQLCREGFGLNDKPNPTFNYIDDKYFKGIGVSNISCGSSFVLLLLTNGKIVSGGDNSDKALARQTDIDNNYQAQYIDNINIENEEILQMSCGRNTTCILLKNGKILTCGDNNTGKLGRSTLELRTYKLDYIDNKNIGNIKFKSISYGCTYNSIFAIPKYY
jgi:alpha-tubulin suppressor-like RCC1 family protein